MEPKEVRSKPDTACLRLSVEWWSGWSVWSDCLCMLIRHTFSAASFYFSCETPVSIITHESPWEKWVPCDACCNFRMKSLSDGRAACKFARWLSMCLKVQQLAGRFLFPIDTNYFFALPSNCFHSIASKMWFTINDCVLVSKNPMPKCKLITKWKATCLEVAHSLNTYTLAKRFFDSFWLPVFSIQLRA